MHPGRRRLLGGALAAAALAPAVRVRRARAGADALSLCQPAHVIPGFDEWFDRRFLPEWSDRHGVRVVVERVPPSDLATRAAADVAAQRGRDLFAFLDLPAPFAAHVLPVDDVVGECEGRFGRLPPFLRRLTSSPRHGRYFALAASWVPSVLHYRADWWGDVGVVPETWERVREGARKVRARHGASAGFGLAPELDSNMVLRGLLWAYGAAEQDEAGRVALEGPAAVEAIRLMTALYREAMLPEVFMWDPSSNNRFYLYGRGSIIQNGISALRSAERMRPEVAAVTTLAPPPAGPAGRLAAPQAVVSYVIWKFARNPEAARRFLVDLVAASEAVCRASLFYNLPAFPGAAPDLRRILAAEPAYALLADAAAWTTNPGHPGFATGAVAEVFRACVIPEMFARAARGELSPEAAARWADAEMRRLFARWAR